MKAYILILALLLAASAATAQGSMGNDDYRQINVSGDAVVNVVPDEIIITLGIETSDMDITTAKEKNNDILEDAIDAARREGVEDTDIQTDHLSIEPRYRDGYRKENFLGYFVRNTVALTVRRVETVENVITRVLEAGVNYIHGIDFQTTEFKKHREKARELALLAAKEKAEKMATVMGQQLGSPLRIDETYSGSPVTYWNSWGHGRARGMSQNVMQNITSGESGVQESIALGKIAIRARVNVSFMISER
ncbi:SIMPL domain-containing protein [bacterium]|nr:SIMPL domain-containing protein [bacterium]